MAGSKTPMQVTLEGGRVEVPKCHNCGKEIMVMIERIGGEDITYEFDGVRFVRVKTDHWGMATIHCGNCGHELNDAERKWVCEHYGET